jgi:hypothetical protein
VSFNQLRIQPGQFVNEGKSTNAGSNNNCSGHLWIVISGLLIVFWRKKKEKKMSVSKVQILSLYRDLLKSSRLFSAYNYKTYVFRRTRDAFHANAQLQDSLAIEAEYKKGLQALTVAKRQGWINSQFQTDGLVVEKD